MDCINEIPVSKTEVSVSSRYLNCLFAMPQSLFDLGSLIRGSNMLFGRSSVVIDSKSISIVKVSFMLGISRTLQDLL